MVLISSYKLTGSNIIIMSFNVLQSFKSLIPSSIIDDIKSNNIIFKTIIKFLLLFSGLVGIFNLIIFLIESKLGFNSLYISIYALTPVPWKNSIINCTIFSVNKINLS